MIKNTDKPANPISEEESDRIHEGVEICTGLTKLEQLAGQNMAAMLGSISLNELSKADDVEKRLTILTNAIINTSTFAAEALLSELDKRKQ